MKVIKIILFLFFSSNSIFSSEYEITVLATNTANFGGIGEWSFSALLESEKEKILFDTGFDENTVIHNAELLKKDLSVVEKVILSHFHGDHTGGLIKLRKTYMDINPKAFSQVYVAEGFFEQRYDAEGNLRGFILKQVLIYSDSGLYVTYDMLNDIPNKSECHDKALYLPYGAHAASIHPILNAFASAAISLRNKLIHGAALSNDVPTASQNSAGDKQVPMDLLADQLFYNAIKAQDIAWYASEEREQAIAVDPSGTYAVAIDPLDGSSNIDINMSVGSIFSIYPAERTAEQSFLCPPKYQIAACYFIFGPQTWLMLTSGKGVLSYRYYPEAGAFSLVHCGVLIAHYSHDFAINMSNYHHWTKSVRAYIDACIDPNQSDGQNSFNMDRIDSLVSET